jgi:diguanylate cyclase (GGDEF)-like protein
MFSPSLQDSAERGRRPWLLGAWLISVSVVIALGLCAFGVNILTDMRREKLDRARLSSANVASTIANDIARNIELYDLSLQAVIDGLRVPEVSRLDPEIRQMVLFDRAATAKHLGRIIVLDENGRLRLNSRQINQGPIDLSSRDYFMAHRDNPNLGLFIGKPFVTVTGHYAVGISRRLNHPDGSFAGVVAGTLWLSYFHDLFRTVTLGEGGILALVGADGTLLMRSPFDIEYTGRDVAQSAAFKRTLSGLSGSFEEVSPVDGTPRIYVYQFASSYPLVLMIGRATAEIASEWRREALYIGAVLLVLALMIVGLATYSAFELRRRAVAEGLLAVLATTDGLTGLNNRRSFNEALVREWKRAQRQGLPISLLMIDVDRFKNYNDRFGHQAGDKALTDIAHCIAAGTRGATDLAARYGGEEIAVLLSGTPLREAYEVAERIRRAIEIKRDADTGVETLPTISVGLACRMPTENDIPCDLVAAADDALYAAKEGGRNRTSVEPGVPLADIAIRMVA